MLKVIISHVHVILVMCVFHCNQQLSLVGELMCLFHPIWKLVCLVFFKSCNDV